MQADQSAAPPSPAAPRPRGRGWVIFWRVAGIALAGLGWWLSIDLLLMTSGAASSNPIISAVCGEDSAAGGCLGVLRSERAFWPVAEGTRPTLPWAAVGAGYFAFLAAWFAFVGPASRRGFAWHLAPMLAVAVGLCISVLLILVMAVELRQWCAGCMAVHVVNVLLAVVTVVSAPWRAERSPQPAHPTAGLALASIVAGIGLLHMNVSLPQMAMSNNALAQYERAYMQIVQDPEFAAWQWSRSPVVQIETDADDAVDGATDAPNTLVAFVDFQCPACRHAHARIGEMLQKHPGRFRVVYRYFPLNRECNPHVAATAHPVACVAARAAEAAYRVGGATARARLSAMLFERQETLSPGNIAAWAREIDIDAAAFARALEDSASAARLTRDVDAAAAVGVKNAPILFLNGRRFDHWRNVDAWDRILAGSP